MNHTRRNDRISILYTQGHTLECLSKRFRLTKSRIGQILDEMGVKKKLQGRDHGWSTKTWKIVPKVLQLFDDGMSIFRIAKSLKSTEATIHNILVIHHRDTKRYAK